MPIMPQPQEWGTSRKINSELKSRRALAFARGLVPAAATAVCSTCTPGSFRKETSSHIEELSN
jgi:hypothetical protein